MRQQPTTGHHGPDGGLHAQPQARQNLQRDHGQEHHGSTVSVLAI